MKKVVMAYAMSSFPFNWITGGKLKWQIRK